MKYAFIFLFTTLTSATMAHVEHVATKMYAVNKQGISKQLGEVTISESEYGLVFSISLAGINPGVHGFHLHQNASCEAVQKKGKTIPALAAGGRTIH